MKKLFEEYGRVITTVIAVVLLISFITTSMNTGGVLYNAFGEMIDGLSAKANSMVNGEDDSNGGSGEEIIYTDFTITAENRHMIGYTGAAGENLVIPATFQDTDGTWYRVIAIGDNAFERCSELGGITIPEGVTSIGTRAFYGCRTLTGALVIPSSVTYIGDYALLTQSNALTEIVVDDANANYCDIDGVLLDKLCTTLICCPMGKAGNIVIPESVTTIAHHAFAECQNLTGNLIIPNSVIEIGDKAFFKCVGFAGNLIIPDNVTSIGSNVFYGCTGFTGDLVIPNSVTTIDKRAFYGCSNITSITMPTSVTSIGDDAFPTPASGYWYSITTGEAFAPSAIPTQTADTYVAVKPEIEYVDFTITEENRHMFGYTDETTNLAIPETFQYDGTWYRVVAIGDNAFAMCFGLTGELVLPDSLITIGSNAFAMCFGLTGELVLPDSLITIGSSAFSGCSGLTGNLVIPNSVATIGSDAFSGCAGFNGTLTLSNQLATIGSNTFSGCSDFTGTLAIPDSVTTIGDYAFYDCSGLTSVIIPNSIISVGAGAFTGVDNAQYNQYDNAYYLGNADNPYLLLVKATNANITSINIHNDTKLIHGRAFENCSKLTGVMIIPDNVTQIGDYAFDGCQSLTGLTIGNSVTIIGYATFSRCSGLTGQLVIPNSVTTIGAMAFYNCKNLTGNLVIPEGITKIGANAFSGCTGLTSVEFSHPNGWWCSLSPTATSGTALGATNLQNTNTALTYLTSTYAGRHWFRSEG